MKFCLSLLLLALFSGTSYAVQLTYEIRVNPAVSSPGVVVSPDHKSAMASAPGDAIGLQLYAIVNSTNTTHTDDGFISGQGSFESGHGGLPGNLRGDAGILATPQNNVPPFALPSVAQSGFQVDVDGDGDLDVGSNLTAGAFFNPLLWFYAISEINGGAAAVRGSGDGAGPTEFLIGQTFFTVKATATSGQHTTVNFIPRVWASVSGGSLHKFLIDGIQRSFGGDNSNVASGAPVQISLGVPDLTPPTLTTVTISSNNGNPAFAKVGDTITVAFSASKALQTPIATIAGQPAVVANVSGNNWQATLIVGAATTEGSTTFSITATDVDGNTAAAVTAATDGSSVTVDRTAPVLTVPGTQIAEATSPNGATVNYPPATATDAATITLSYSQDSGSVFPLLNTTVTVTATDAAGNVTVGSFTVMVQDTTPPVLTVLGSNPAITEAGMQYVDAGATAFDAALGDLTSSIRATSNVNVTMVGTYKVTYRVIDLAEHAVSAFRTVEVMDTTAPTITHLPDPSLVTADATNHAPAPDLTGQVTATDYVGVTSIVQDPAPGTILSYGPHTVTFTVSDAAHNSTSGSTVLTVADGPALVGRYAGLLSTTQVANTAQDRNGPRTNGRIIESGAVRALMELKLTKGRFLTGYLRLADKRRVRLPGTILPAATHAETLTLSDGSSLALTFDGSGHVAATLSGGAFSLSGDGVLADPGAPAGVPGTYTAILEADGATAPGWLYSVVSKSGAMRISGRLPDGSTINSGQGSIVDRHGDALVFVLGNSAAHPLLAGRVHFENLATSDFSGALAFNDAPCAANGARFTPASSGLPPGSYPFTLEGAGIDLASIVTLLPNNTATVLAPVTWFYPRSSPGKPATGIFYTKFTTTANRPIIKGSGIFHQKLGVGAGQFPRNGGVGRLQLGTAP